MHTNRLRAIKIARTIRGDGPGSADIHHIMPSPLLLNRQTYCPSRVWSASRKILSTKTRSRSSSLLLPGRQWRRGRAPLSQHDRLISAVCLPCNCIEKNKCGADWENKKITAYFFSPSFCGFPYPSTEKMTNPAKKLVKQLMLLVSNASR